MSEYAHYSNIDPEFAKIKDVTDATFGPLWSLPLDQMKFEIAKAPPALGDYVPDDINMHHEAVAVRDGAEIDVKIYKSKTVSPKASLFLVSHGGGWVVGSHGTEEAMNRIVAGKSETVVVSADYRM
jgi:acetyl esterase/lipase